jgi:DNA-binding transcriptional ArsR family regulator
LAKPDPEARLDALDALFSALGHRSRRQILMTLWFRGGTMSAGDIAGRFHVAWPTITRHLQVLEAAGLITHERRAQERLYRVEAHALKTMEEWLGWFKKRGAHG